MTTHTVVRLVAAGVVVVLGLLIALIVSVPDEPAGAYHCDPWGALVLPLSDCDTDAGAPDRHEHAYAEAPDADSNSETQGEPFGVPDCGERKPVVQRKGVRCGPVEPAVEAPAYRPPDVAAL